MKSLVITLVTAALLSAGVFATGQSFNIASAGMILFAASVVGFAFADYARRPRLALRRAMPAPRRAAVVASAKPVADYAVTVSFNTLAA